MLVRSFAHGNIANGRGDKSSLRTFQRAKHNFDGETRAVFAQSREFDPGSDHLRERVRGTARAVGEDAFGKAFRNDIFYFLPDQFIAMIAKLFFGLNIEEDYFAGLVDNHHGVGSGFEQTAIFSAGFLGFADVGISAEPTGHFALGITNRNGAGKKRTVGTIASTKRKGIVPDFAGLEAFGDLVHDALNVVGVVHFFPTPASHLVQGSAGIIKPSLVVPEDVAFFVGHPGQLRNIVGHGAKSVFALAKRDFGISAGGNVAANQ